MKSVLYVVSDIHLGGEPCQEASRGFQICPQRNQEALADFIRKLPISSENSDVHLVLAGDIVDFLAEKEFAAFTAAPGKALTKLKHIVQHSEPVWKALTNFVGNGNALTLMLGNHDIEMSFPDSRRFLMDLIGKGRVSFIYDNEAFTQGPVLIEHGNRYDGWNAVAHGALRRARSRLSRGLDVENFPIMPGSRLVVDVMNPLKRDYSFIDLLKPENAGSLPLLASMGAGGIRDIWKAYKSYRRQAAVDFDEEFEPQDETYIAEIPSTETDLYKMAQSIAAGGEAEEISLLDIGGWRDEIGDTIRKLRRKGLHRIFSSEATAKSHQQTFKIGQEDATYLTPARAAAERGFKLIVYGHTHLTKRVDLDKARYFNTGTWADLMRVPPSVWGKDKDIATTTLNSFVDDVEADNVGHWRRFVPTYARIVLDDDQIVQDETNVYFADNHDPVSDEGLEVRLN